MGIAVFGIGFYLLFFLLRFIVWFFDIIGERSAKHNGGEQKQMDLIEQGIWRRKKIMKFIEAYIHEHGYSPSIREICNEVGLASSSTVQRHLEILKAEGKIRWNPKVARTVRIANEKS